MLSIFSIVILAKAGIQKNFYAFRIADSLDSRFRGNDKDHGSREFFPVGLYGQKVTGTVRPDMLAAVGALSL